MAYLIAELVRDLEIPAGTSNQHKGYSNSPYLFFYSDCNWAVRQHESKLPQSNIIHDLVLVLDLNIIANFTLRKQITFQPVCAQFYTHYMNMGKDIPWSFQQRICPLFRDCNIGFRIWKIHSCWNKHPNLRGKNKDFFYRNEIPFILSFQGKVQLTIPAKPFLTQAVKL